MELDLTIAALLQIAAALYMARRINTKRFNRARARVSTSLSRWLYQGDVYFMMDVERFGR